MLDRKCIFITGAAEGIGRATALHFVEKGWYVGLFDVNVEKLKVLAQEIGEERCCYLQMDVSKTDEVKKTIAHFGVQTGGRMDVLFNNAGIYRVGCFEEMSIEEHRNTISINVMGVLNCIHSAFEMLKQTPASHIISMCSSSAVYGMPEIATYSCSKFAVRAITEALDIEFERHDISVSDIMVGYVQTPLLEKTPVSFSLQRSEVKVTAEQVAETVWEAVHGNKLHWRINLKLMLFIIWLFPFLKRSLMKRSTWNKN